jgi:IMP cyclohydrolase
MTNSAFRRNVAEHFGIASAADIKARRYMPTFEDANVVSTFVAATELAWIECDTEDEARLLENRLKAEFMPPFTAIAAANSTRQGENERLGVYLASEPGSDTRGWS